VGGGFSYHHLSVRSFWQSIVKMERVHELPPLPEEMLQPDSLHWKIPMEEYQEQDPNIFYHAIASEEALELKGEEF
jgi:hypothetical protein